MPSTNRRTFLALGSAAITGLAGCSALESAETAYQVEVQNSSRQPRRFRVTVLNPEGDALYDEWFALDARMMEEETEPFTGTPSRLRLTVDDATPIETDWPTHLTEIRNGSEVRHVSNGCGFTSGESVTGVFVYVSSPNLVSLRPTCATVRQ